MKDYRAKETVHLFEDHTVAIETEQYLDAGYWNDLAQAKEEFSLQNSGYQKVASIPTALVNKWYREGFNIYSEEATINEINKRLRKQEFDKLIITGDVKF